MEVLDALNRARAAAEDARVDEAWSEYNSARPALSAGGRSPIAAARGADLEPALLALGRAFLQRDDIEKALDVWGRAAAVGSRTAAASIVDALQQRGWPYWVRQDTLPALPLHPERLPDPAFGGCVLLGEAGPLLAAERDPLSDQPYPYSLAMLAPPAGSVVSSARSQLTSAGGEPGFLRLRLLIHYQRPSDEELARGLARRFAVCDRLMEANAGRHTRFDENGRVHVWLVTGGAAGGEQWKEHLFFYDLDRARSNLEWMREAAHEYGHECLPGTGGFTAPELWADGELGERLILRWIARSGDSGALLDALGMKRTGLDAYLSRYVEPLVERTAREGWRPDRVALRDEEAMERVNGLALWAEDAHGTPYLRDLLNAVPHNGPTGLWAGYVTALKRALAAPGAAPLRIAPVAGIVRFYLPQPGRYRLARLGRGGPPVRLVYGAGVPATSPGQDGVRSREAGANGAARARVERPLEVPSGGVLVGQEGWYRALPPIGALTIRRLAG